MTIKGHAGFWLAAYVVLIIVYANAFESYLFSLYFVSILFPVVIGTAYFFNFMLVPRYLMTGRKAKFVLYFIYMLIVSAHLEIIMIFLAFIYLANYQVQAMHPSILDVSKLSVTLYAIVFAQGFFLLFRKFQASTFQIEKLEKERKKSEEGFLVVRADRQNRKILHKDILYIESLSDYIKIYCIEGTTPIVSKAKISHIENELPQAFIRIHRSFLVHLQHVSAFNAEQVTVGDEQLPISRSYKSQVREALFGEA